MKSDMAYAENVAKGLDRREHVADLEKSDSPGQSDLTNDDAANDKAIAELLQEDCVNAGAVARTEW